MIAAENALFGRIFTQWSCGRSRSRRLGPDLVIVAVTLAAPPPGLSPLKVHATGCITLRRDRVSSRSSTRITLGQLTGPRQQLPDEHG
jgi:hypothetical protein